MYNESGSSESRDRRTQVRSVQRAARAVKVRKEQLEGLTVTELMELARQVDIPKRSKMKKTELIRALTGYAQ